MTIIEQLQEVELRAVNVRNHIKGRRPMNVDREALKNVCQEEGIDFNTGVRLFQLGWDAMKVVAQNEVLTGVDDMKEVMGI